MRDELHLMELVDRYLDGGMGQEERASFEDRLASNGELRMLVEDQRALREGLERVRLRGAVASAHRRWTIMHRLPWAAAGLVVLAAAIWSARTASQERPSSVEVRPDTVMRVSDHVADLTCADSLEAPEEVDMRVETVFTETRRIRPEAADPDRSEGRIVTRLITEGANDVHEKVVQEVGSAGPLVPVISAPAADTLEWGVGYRMPSAGKAGPVEVEQVDQELNIVATVERLENATKPEFPGGIDGLERFLRESVKQPRGTKKAGMVTVGFTLNKKGEVVNAQVLRSLGRAYDAEALRVVSAMPDWAPSRVGDRAVRSKVQVRVRFLGSGSRPATEQRAAEPLEK